MTVRQQTYDRLDQLTEFEQNWDGYDCVKPCIESITRARAWVATPAFDAFGNTMPLVTADNSGEVLFEWRFDDFEINIWFVRRQ